MALSTARFAGIAITLALLLAGVQSPLHAVEPVHRDSTPSRLPANAAELAGLVSALERQHAMYNPQTGMLLHPIQSPGYHTTLKGGNVHATRTALEYAVACLDSGTQDLLERASRTLDAVLALQDRDPASRTYGIWPWYLEEPLAKMAPPDFNWADFCGVQLLQVALDHESRLTPELAARIKSAVRSACEAIRKRDVKPDYTNIAIMGTYVTLIAAQKFGWEDMRTYGMSRLRTFSDHLKRTGGFTEYNSPTYTVVALTEVARLINDTTDNTVREMASEIYRSGWHDFARHFHPTSGQLAGPHSRSYGTLLSGGTRGFLTRAFTGRIDFGGDTSPSDAFRPRVTGPPEFEPFFRAIVNPRTVIQQYGEAKPPVVATTWLHPKYTLGTVSRSEMWNQRRNIVAYWGTPEKPVSLRLRFLRDGYDFAAAQIYTAQKEGAALALINFATDGGNTHVSIDRLIDGKFTAKDLRLSFEFEGHAIPVTKPVPERWDAPVRLSVSGQNVAFQIPFALFDGATPRWDINVSNRKLTYDLILYTGPERPFDLSKLEQAAVAVALQMNEGTAPMPMPRPMVHRSGDQLVLTDGPLRVTATLRPEKRRTLHASASVAVEPDPKSEPKAAK